jgi:hypothetical protein
MISLQAISMEKSTFNEANSSEAYPEIIRLL